MNDPDRIPAPNGNDGSAVGNVPAGVDASSTGAVWAAHAVPGIATRRGVGARIAVTNMVKTYFHGGMPLHVLNDVNVVLEPGDMVAVVGASGVGKSTLLQILGTLDLPSTGSIRFDDEEITTMNAQRLSEFRNRKIGFVFQFHHLLPEFTALENVMMPALIQRVAPAIARARAMAILGAVWRRTTARRVGTRDGA